MESGEKGILGSFQAKSILDSILGSSQVGFFRWNIVKNEFIVMEDISKKQFDNVNNLPYFIHQIAHKKDREIALQDIENFLNNNEQYYQSTFRIVDVNNDTYWVFCKGIMLDSSTLGAIIYDVTGDKFMQGHDRTTNLLNAKMFMRKLENAIDYTKASNKLGALLYLDIDNLHSILNKHGFEFGSRLLLQFSQKLITFLREEDELARFPYDKFMLYLSDIDNLLDVKQISREILDLFKEPFHIDGYKIYLTVNIGVTTLPDKSDDADELIRQCNFALSHAHERGNNQIVFFDSDLMAERNREMDIESELPSAILDNELSLVYQPQVDMKKKKIVGYEVLVRWHNKNLGPVSPGEFIPVAENKGYIVSIGRWIRRETIKTVRRWINKGFDFETVSINVSSVELKQSNFKERLILYCRQYDVDPGKIEIEITERTLMDTTDENERIIDGLIAAGFKIALDDFGTGYSNLSSLLRFQVNTLKLDKSIVDNIRDHRQSYILKGIIGGKDNLYTSIIAEGVEDKETVDVLMDLGFDHIQGYYFCRPLSRDEIEQFTIDFNAKKAEKA